VSPGLAAAHDEVCFTPQAPEDGGRRNAFLFRRLNKAKSLKALERVMLAVAEGGPGGEGEETTSLGWTREGGGTRAHE
jgi:hypothetical protein